MGHTKVILSGIPENIQNRYGIGGIAHAVASTEEEGLFEIQKPDGQKTTVPADELFGAGIKVQRVAAEKAE